MMHSSRTLLITLGVFFLLPSAGASAGKPPSQGRHPADTLKGKTHEEIYEEQFEKLSPQPMKPPLTPGRRLSSSAFPNIDISRDTFPQNEPSVRISHTDPNRVLAAWRDFRTGVTPAVRRVGYSFSTDGGATWGTPDLLPLYFGSAGLTRNSDPAVCVDEEGRFYVATIALDDFNGRLKVMVHRQSDLGDFFDYAAFVPVDTPNIFNDKEYIACDLNPGSPWLGNLYITWSGSHFSRSTNHGQTWDTVIVLPGSAGSAFAPDLCVGPDGSVNVVSLVGSSIYFEKSTDGGATFLPGRSVDTSGIINSPYGGGFPSIAADIGAGPRRGNLYAAWSDGRNGHQDVFLSRSTDGGDSWSPARRVNDTPPGDTTDQYWPWVAVDERGVVSVVFYDKRNVPDPAYFEARLAHSWDGGLSFTDRLLSAVGSPRNMPNGDVRFGDYIGLDAWGGHTIPVWTDERAGGYDMSIYTAALDTLPMLDFSGIALDVRTGWNLLSLPVRPPNAFRSSVFRGSSHDVFGWDGTYHLRDTLVQGAGYWVRYAAGGEVNVVGDTLLTDTVSVVAGWNLLGSLTVPIPVGSIGSEPPAMATSRFFTYAGGYRVVDTIPPGMGFWVKADQPGTLILNSAGATALPSRIRVAALDDAPPPPPDGLDSPPRLPAAYSLHEAYPNPFNPSATIEYELPALSRVSLVVHDLLGRKVTTLADGIEEGGVKRVKWNAAGNAGGVYFYRLTARRLDGTPVSFTEVRKIVLLR